MFGGMNMNGMNLSEMAKMLSAGGAQTNKTVCDCGKFSCTLTQSYLNNIAIFIKATQHAAPALTAGVRYQVVELREATNEDRSFEAVVIDNDGVKCYVKGTWGVLAEDVKELHAVIDPKMMDEQKERLKVQLAELKALEKTESGEGVAGSVEELTKFFETYHKPEYFKAGSIVGWKKDYIPSYLAASSRGVEKFVVIDPDHKAVWPHGEPTDLLLGYIDTDGERVVINSSSFRMQLIQE